jgi:hypothetical protein
MTNLEFLTGEKFKNEAIPGSKTYYFNNRVVKDKYKYDRSEEEIQKLKKFLPRKFEIHSNGHPEEMLRELGWQYNTTLKKFFNDMYKNDDNSYVFFDCAVKVYNKKRYLLPLSKTGHFDQYGITWIYKKVSCIWYLERNSPNDFWNTRRGKRMSKYIEYRKRRTKRQQMYS